MNIKIVKMGIVSLCVVLIIVGIFLMNGGNVLFVPQVVLPYLIWFGGIIVFCIILPGKVGTVFD